MNKAGQRDSFNAKKLVLLVLLLAVYYAWVQFENQTLSKPLYELSLKHIRVFRSKYSKIKVLEVVMELVSQLGDKFGAFGYSLLAFNLMNGGHSFILSC